VGDEDAGAAANVTALEEPGREGDDAPEQITAAETDGERVFS
jgi:hypothetical protein